MDFFSGSDLCRLCLCKSKSLIHIFHFTGYVIADVISDLLLFEVTREDGYPPFLCYQCFDKLMEFKSFKERCRASKLTYEREFLQSKIVLTDGNAQDNEGVEMNAETASEVLPTEGDAEEECFVDRNDTQFEIHMSPVKLEYDEDHVYSSNQNEDADEQQVDRSSQETDFSTQPIQLYDTCGKIADMTDRLHPDVAVNNTSDDSGMEVALTSIKVEPEEHAEDEEVPCNPIDFVQTSLEYEKFPQVTFEMIKVEHEEAPYEEVNQYQSERTKQLNRERQRRHRASYTPEKLMQTRLLDAQRQAFKRMNETAEERRERRLLDAQRMARKRMNETPEEKARRRRIEAERQALKRRQKRMLAVSQP